MRNKALSPFKVILYKERGKFFEVLKKRVKAKKVGVNFSNLNLNFNKFVKKGLKGKKLIDVSGIVSGMRSVKDKDEIKIIQKSCTIADNILTKCIRTFKKFKAVSNKPIPCETYLEVLRILLKKPGYTLWLDASQ